MPSTTPPRPRPSTPSAPPASAPPTASAPSPPVAVLSPREQLILRSLHRDGTLAEIAAELYVSRNTVKTQVQSVYRKLGVTRRAQAVEAGHRLLLD